MSDGYQAAELADMLREGEFNSDIDAVLSDDEIVGDVLVRLDEGPLRELLAKQSSTDMMRRARRQGDVTSMSAATGLSDNSVEATGYDMLINRCTPAAQQVLIKGEKGSGKTVLGLDLMKRLYAAFDGEISFFTNVRGPDEHEAVTFGETMSEMLEWVRDTDGEKCVLGDEWSTTMNSHAHPGGDIRQTVSRFINALRKGQGGSTRLIIIGHEHDTDIASIIRTQADVVVHKAGKADEGLADQASVFDGWNAFVQQETAFKIRGLRDVPISSPWSADTNYFAYFEPDLDNPRQQIKRGKLIENWEEYQEGDDGDDVGKSEHVQCRGEKTDGSECNASVKHESGYCHAHRHQWGGDPDPRFE